MGWLVLYALEGGLAGFVGMGSWGRGVVDADRVARRGAVAGLPLHLVAAGLEPT